MPQPHCDPLLAGTIGESLRALRGRVVTNLAGLSGDEDSLGLYRAVDCPFCRCAVPYPGQAGDGSAALAECLVCDVYFDYRPNDVYAARHDSTRGVVLSD
jgi:hypothetical protein